MFYIGLHYCRGTQFSHLQLNFTFPLKPSGSEALKNTLSLVPQLKTEVFLHLI